MTIAVGNDDILSVTRDLITSQHAERVAMESQWLIVSMFCRGLQNINNYDPYTTGISLTNSENLPRFAGYNLFRSTLTRTKSMLMQSPPRREAKPTRDDVLAVEKARLYSVVMDDFYHRFKIEEKSQVVADGFLKSGVFVISFFFDPTKGEVIANRPDGTPLRTGQLVPRFDPAERWIWDPRAAARDEVLIAVRRTIRATEEMVGIYPEMKDELMSLQSDITDADLLENRLLNATQRQSLYTARQIPKSKGRVVVFEVYEEPCPDYPSGRHAILAGSTSTPRIMLKDYGANHYGEIPAVLFVQDIDAHCLMGNGSFFNDLIAPQREINKRANLDIAAADMTGNPRMLAPLRGGTPLGDFTNDIAEVVTYDPQDGPPHYMEPPRQSDFAQKAKEFAVQMFSAMAPTSSSDITQAEKTTSGFHASLIAEERKKSITPLIRNWEIGWDGTHKMYCRLFRKLTIYPQQLRSLGPRGQIGFESISGLDLSDDVEVGVVPFSSMPTSRTAAFAEWSELLKLGYGRIDTPLRPEVERRMLEDIGKGDMTSTWRDFEADQKNADYVVSQIRMGERVVPRVQDNPDLITEEILNFMKTADYRVQLREDPMLEKRCVDALAMFGLYKQIRDQQMMMAQANMAYNTQMIAASGFQGPQNPVQAANQTFAPGAPQGGAEAKMSQGMSRAPNPNKDAGGNPR